MPPSRTDSKSPFRQREELLDFLLEVSSLAGETLDLDRLLGDVMQVITRSIPAELFAILLYSERRKSLRIRHAIGHREELVRSLEIRLGEGIVGTAALTRKPVCVGDVRKDTRYLSAVDAVRSEMAVPMIARGRLVGVIDLESTEVDAFHAEELAMLSLIASRVAAAVDNARLHRRLERNNRTLRTLTALAQEFSSILDLDALLSRIAVAMKALVDFDAFSILLVEGNSLRHRFSQRYDERVQLDNIPIGEGVTGHAAALREPILVADTQTDPRYIPGHPDICSELAIPLIAKDRVIGVLDLESEKLSYFTEDHLRTLSVLAPQIAVAIENARLYEEVETRKREMEEDLSAARRLQRVMMPRTAPDIPGLSIAIASRAARDVSGDIYDFFEHQRDYALIAFGDSSGKGPAAALYGALVSGLLRMLGPRRRGPAMLLKALNEVLMERRMAAQYVTLLSMLWSESRRQLTMANAGALPPLIVRGKMLIRPPVAGVPIGLLDEREYEETTVDLERDDTIVLYSDGVPDQVDGSGQEFAETRIEKLLTKVSHLDPQRIVDHLFAALDHYRGNVPLSDDQTLMVMKVL